MDENLNNQQPSFTTERIRRLGSTTLDGADQRTLRNIEQYGCSVVHVKQSTGSPGWSYTIGAYDTCEKPEVITVGLRENTAQFLLNEATSRLRRGVDLSEGRHARLIGNVECEFRPVDPKWVKPLMGWARWYYDGSDSFPVLQAVYPDLQNRFPGHPEFDSAFGQPLLQPGVPFTKVEQDFWASADPKSSLFNWRFPDTPRTQVFISNAVHTGSEPITYVSHDEEDGAWQFLGDGMAGSDGPVLVCFHHVIDTDPTIEELADMPVGWWAERAALGAKWVRRRHDGGKGDA